VGIFDRFFKTSVFKRIIEIHYCQICWYTSNDEVFDDARPSRKFIIGTLAAPRNKDLLFHDTEGDRASIRAQRLKVSFLVDRSKIDESSEIALKNYRECLLPS